MAAFLTVSSSADVTNGVAINDMVKCLKLIDERKSGAVLNMTDTTLIVKKGYGPAQVDVTHNGQTTSQKLDGKKDDYIVVAGGALVHLRHVDPTRCWTIDVTPSGEARFTRGIEQAAPAVPEGLDEQATAIHQWLYDGEVGSSSLALAQHLYLIPNGFKERTDKDISKSIPYDADDFSRCVLLLRRAPFLAERIKEMAQVSEEWAQLVRKNGDEPSAWEKGVHEGEVLLAKNLPTPPSNAGVYRK